MTYNNRINCACKCVLCRFGKSSHQLMQYFRCFCELKDMKGCRSSDVGDDNKHAPKRGYALSAKVVSPNRFATSSTVPQICIALIICLAGFSQLPLAHSRVYPYPGPTESESHSRVHLTPSQIKENFSKAAKIAAVAAHIAGLKHTRPQPEALTDHYDNQLEQMYLREWPDAVTKYKNKRRSCLCPDPERDNDSRATFKKVFPPYLYHLLAFSGAIPPSSKPYFYFVAIIWTLMFAFYIYVVLLFGYTLILQVCEWETERDRVHAHSSGEREKERERESEWVCVCPC